MSIIFCTSSMFETGLQIKPAVERGAAYAFSWANNSFLVNTRGLNHTNHRQSCPWVLAWCQDSPWPCPGYINRNKFSSLYNITIGEGTASGVGTLPECRPASPVLFRCKSGACSFPAWTCHSNQDNGEWQHRKGGNRIYKKIFEEDALNDVWIRCSLDENGL